MPSNFYGCFRHETCSSEDCSKIAKFWAKTMSNGHRSVDVDDLQWQTRFIRKGHNWWGILDVWLRHWNDIKWQSSEESRPKKHLKFGRMWRFCLLVSSITITWCIINSCHKVVSSIRNTTLKLRADCPKQFVRNEQNFGKTNYGFFIIIMNQLTHRCLSMSFWPKKKKP